LGVDKAKTTYADQVPTAVKTLREETIALADIENAGGYTSQADKLKALISPIADYEAGFKGVVALVQQRGVVDDGLIASFRTSAHDVEATITSINDADLNVLYLQM